MEGLAKAAGRNLELLRERRPLNHDITRELREWSPSPWSTERALGAMSDRKWDFSLHLVTDRGQARGRGTLDVIRSAVRGGVTCVQLRDKGASARELIREGRAERPGSCSALWASPW